MHVLATHADEFDCVSGGWPGGWGTRNDGGCVPLAVSRCQSLPVGDCLPRLLDAKPPSGLGGLAAWRRFADAQPVDLQVRGWKRHGVRDGRAQSD